MLSPRYTIPPTSGGIISRRMLRATRTQAPRADLRAGGELHSLRLAVEIEVAVHGLRGVAHLARAAYRDAAGALHVEGEFAAGIFLVGELAIALRTGVAQHLRRIVGLVVTRDVPSHCTVVGANGILGVEEPAVAAR